MFKESEVFIGVRNCETGWGGKNHDDANKNVTRDHVSCSCLFCLVFCFCFCFFFLFLDGWVELYFSNQVIVCLTGRWRNGLETIIGKKRG